MAPLTWEECVALALENHPDLVSSRESIVQSKAEKDITKSTLWPQADADVGITTSKNDGSERSENYSYAASGSQLLFDGLKTSQELKADEQRIVASQFSYLVTSSNIRLRLRTAFIDLLQQQQLLHITQEILKRRQQSLELVQLRYDGGREHKGSLLTSEANFKQAQADVLAAQRALEFAQRRLNKEMGRAFMPLEAKGELIVMQIQAQQPHFETLAQTTPFLKELMARKEAAKYGIGSAKAEYFPVVFATADIGRSDSRWPPQDDAWGAGIRVTLPLFDGFNRKANVNRAQSVYRQTNADERSGRDGVILTLHQTWAQLQDAIENVDVQNKFLQAAQERATISEAQYSNGLITFDDWVIIEDTLVRVKRTFLQAQADALVAEANWVQAKGGTLENEN